MRRNRMIRIGIVLLLAMLAGVVPAGVPVQAQTSAGEEYTVQAGDWLTKIADKYYGNPRDYLLIIDATNAKAATDASFKPIDNPNLIYAGQKLWVPRKQGENLVTAGDITFEKTTIEGLGIGVVFPSFWSRFELNDPLLANAWGASQFSFVSFTTTPGNHPQFGLARLLGVRPEDLTTELLGGQLSEMQVGEHTWSLYTRDDGGLASISAATVEQKVIYQVSLFAASSQKDIILNAILENFEIIDPAAAQQRITLETPTSGATLTNPFELRGSTSEYPFRGSLVYRVLDAEGNQVGRAPFEVVGKIGNPATFAIAASYEVETDGPGTLEVAEISASDGTIIAIDSVAVLLAADPPGYEITIDDPTPYASVSSPVQIRGKTENKPFEGTLNYRIVDAAGREISTGSMQTSGSIGQINLFDRFATYSIQENGPGRIEVFDVNEADGSTLTIRTVNVWLTAQ